MALYDQHIHSRFSTDSQAEPADCVRRAIEVGLAGVTFTDHFDTHPTEWHLCRYDYQGIADVVADLRAEFGDRIFIGHGIEVCYQPEQMGMILPYLAAHEFDIVILSAHWAAGRAMHEREHWEGWDASAGTRAYLEAVLEAVEFVASLQRQGQRPFDVLGHLDLVKRYTQRYFSTFDVRSHGELVDEILRACIRIDLVPEVNLSTLRQSLPEPMPAEWVVRRFAELGGTAMSLGSDAHTAECVGQGLKEATAMLKQQGVVNLSVFKRRCREDIEL